MMKCFNFVKIWHKGESYQLMKLSVQFVLLFILLTLASVSYGQEKSYQYSEITPGKNISAQTG